MLWHPLTVQGAFVGSFRFPWVGPRKVFGTLSRAGLLTRSQCRACLGRREATLAYIAFRRAIISEEIPAFTCLVGTLAQEVHATSPAIREASGASIFGHAATLEADIQAAIDARGITPDGWDAASLARHFQAVLQGGFILAKAGNDPDLARESINHLDRYVRLLFGVTDHPQCKE